MSRYNECFYCGATIANAKGRLEMDHFPIPKEAGGQEVVACCVGCHDMKDRISLAEWSSEAIASVTADFPKLSRFTRIFLARALRIAFSATTFAEKKP